MYSKEFDPKTTLLQLKEFAEDLIALRDATSEEALFEDKSIQRQMMYLVIMLGEATGRIIDWLKEHYSNYPWGAVKGIRNRIVHDYDYVDYRRVHLHLQEELDPLLTKINEILDDLEEA